MKFQLDTNQSIIFWKGFANDKFAKGSLNFKYGSILYEEERIAKGTLVIDMASVKVKEDNLGDLDKETITDLLKSEEFFQVELYPEVSFSILGTDFLIDSDQTNSAGKIPKGPQPTHLIEGELTVRGITYRMELPIHIENLGFQIKARGTVNLKDVNKEAYKLLEENAEDFQLPEIELDLNIVANQAEIGGSFTDNI